MPSVRLPSIVLASLTCAALFLIATWWSGGGDAIGRPASIVVAAALLAFALAVGAATRFDVSRSGLVMLVSTTLLAIWVAASSIWSSQQHEGLLMGGMYLGAAAFMTIGVLVARSRAAVRVALFGITATALLTTLYGGWFLLKNDPVMFDGGRLVGPLGYYNGQAAFLLMSVPIGLALGCTRDLVWPLRAVAIGTAATALEFSMFAQSRGALIGIAAAVVVGGLLTPRRLRAIIPTAIVLVPTATLLPMVERALRSTEEAPVALRSSGVALITTLIASTAAGAVWAVLDRRIQIPARALRGMRIGLAALVGCVVIATCVIGGPRGAKWAGDQRRALTSDAPAAQQAEVTGDRLGSFATGSAKARIDMWEVAIEAWRTERVHGLGARGWEDFNYKHRDVVNGRYVKQPHSNVLELLAEGGLIAVALLGAAVLAIAACTLSLLRSDTSSSTRIAIAGIASALTLVFVHGLFEWFSGLPAISYAAAFLAGLVAGAPWRVRRGGEPREARFERQSRWTPRRLALPAVCVTAIAAMLAIGAPALISAELAARAKKSASDDRAEDLLLLAARISPRDLQVREQLARRARADRKNDAALEAARALRRIAPENWEANYVAARTNERAGRSNEAAAAFATAAEQNPLEARMGGWAP